MGGEKNCKLPSGDKYVSLDKLVVKTTKIPRQFGYNAKHSAHRYPKIVEYEGSGVDLEMKEGIIYYPKHMMKVVTPTGNTLIQQVSLRDILPSDVLLSESSLGKLINMLSELTTHENPSHLHQLKFFISGRNTEADSCFQYLLPGVVSDQNKNMAKSLWIRIDTWAQANGCRSLVESRYKKSGGTPFNYVSLADGQIEALCMIMRRLMSQDLVEWKEATARHRQKSLLWHCWNRLANDEIKELIATYANFADHNTVSRECANIVKSTIRFIVKDYSFQEKKGLISEDESNAYSKLIMSFMEECNIHHYICNHTFNMANNEMSNLRNELSVRLTHFCAKAGFFTQEDVAQLFKTLTDKQEVSSQLRYRVNYAALWYCEAFIDKIKKGGYLAGANGIHESYVNSFLNDLPPMSKEPMSKLFRPHISQSVESKIIIYIELGFQTIGQEEVPFKTSQAAKLFVCSLCLFLYSTTRSALKKGARRHLETGNKEWSDLLAKNIQMFMSDIEDEHRLNFDLWNCAEDSEYDEDWVEEETTATTVKRMLYKYEGRKMNYKISAKELKELKKDAASFGYSPACDEDDVSDNEERPRPRKLAPSRPIADATVAKRQHFNTNHAIGESKQQLQLLVSINIKTKKRKNSDTTTSAPVIKKKEITVPVSTGIENTFNVVDRYKSANGKHSRSLCPVCMKRTTGDVIALVGHVDKHGRVITIICCSDCRIILNKRVKDAAILAERVLDGYKTPLLYKFDGKGAEDDEADDRISKCLRVIIPQSDMSLNRNTKLSYNLNYRERVQEQQHNSSFTFFV